MARARRPPRKDASGRTRRRKAGAAGAVSWRSAWPADQRVGRATRAPSAVRAPVDEPQTQEILRVPVLAEGADPGRTAPSPLAVRDRLLVDRRLVGDHGPERLFAYDVTTANMKHLRGVAAPGDRVVFRRGGEVTPDRICAVRTGRGIVLSRALVQDRSVLLLPGEGETDFESLPIGEGRAASDVVAGTHVLLIRR